MGHMQQSVGHQVDYLQPTAIFHQTVSCHSEAGLSAAISMQRFNPWLGTDLPPACSPIPEHYISRLFCVGQVKHKFYTTKVTGIEDPKTRIRDVIMAINRDMVMAHGIVT
jgi:hypothetical protein